MKHAHVSFTEHGKISACQERQDAHVSLKDLSVFLCKLDTAILAASCKKHPGSARALEILIHATEDQTGDVCTPVHSQGESLSWMQQFLLQAHPARWS